MDSNSIGKILDRIVDKGGPYGIALAVLVILYMVAAYRGLFPKYTRRTSSFVIFSTIGIVALGLLLPTFNKWIFRVQTVDVVLVDESGNLVPIAFSAKYRHSDRGVITIDGTDGAAEARGFPVGDTEINLIAVNAPGWTARHLGRSAVDDGQVTIVMVQGVPAPPPDETQRPDPTPFAPTTAQLTTKPAVEPSGVTLHYGNHTGAQLSLVLFPYKPGNAKDLWTLATTWLDFPTSSQLNVYDKFKSGSGWFGIWARDSQGKHWPLGLHNLFSAAEPVLWIEKSDKDSGNPYKVEIIFGGTTTAVPGHK